MTQNSPDQVNAPESSPPLTAENTESPALTTTTAAEAGIAQNVSESSASSQPAEMPGERLAAKRRQMRWSIDEAARKLKLAPRQIEAVEANDFAALPGMATARGFIRSYAKLLELEPEPLLELIAGEPNPAFEPIVVRRPLPSSGFPGRRYASSSGSHRGAARNMAGLALLVLIFLAIVAFSANRMGWLPLPFNIGGLGVIPAPETIAEAPATSQFNSDLPLAEPIPPAQPIKQANALEINPRQDAWVEITNEAGNKLVSRLMKAGSSERFDIAEPVVLVIGNASGVDASFRGEPLNLRSVARDNVSRLSLK